MWVKGTGAVRSTDTVLFKQKHITNPNVTPADAIVNASKYLTAALKGNVPGSLGATSLDDLKQLEEIFAQKAKSYKALIPVEAEPPRVREEAATPPRVATPTAQQNMIRRAQRLPGDWPPAEGCHRTDEFPEGHGISEVVPEVRPNEDKEDKEIPEQPSFSTQ